MGCYHPLYAIPFPDLNTGKIKPQIIGSKDTVPDLDDQIYSSLMKLPCGHCVGCRLDYSRAWADRMMLELQHTKKGIFLTCTYDNEHLDEENKSKLSDIADDGRIWFGDFAVPQLSLRKRDCQLFMKRLRKYFTGKEIRFYASGEYGENTARPHLHFILFGIELSDVTSEDEYFFSNQFGDRIYKSSLIKEIWKNGNVTVSNVSWKTCAYVARYIMKKQYGDRKYAFSDFGIEQEFSLMSRRPGIGAYYFDDLDSEFDPQIKYISINDNGQGMKISVPKYFMKSLEKVDPETYNRIMSERRVFVSDRELLKMQQTDLNLCEVLEKEEKEKISKIGSLVRMLDKCL